MDSARATGPKRERLEARTMPAPPPFLFDLPSQGSDVLNRLHAFLPQIRDANMRLQQQSEGRHGDEQAVHNEEVEDDEEQEEVIVLEEIESSDSSDSDSDDSDGSDGSDEHYDDDRDSETGVKRADDDDSAMAQTPPPPAATGLSYLLDIQGTLANTAPSSPPTKALPSRKGKITLIQEIDVGQDE